MTIDSAQISEIIAAWEEQPGYGDPRVRELIDSAADRLREASEDAEVLEILKNLKVQVQEIYATPETPEPGTLPPLIQTLDSYAQSTSEQIQEDLEKQYSNRLATMRYFGIISDETNPEVECIDNVSRTAPTAQNIWVELSKPENSAKMEAIKTLKKPKLVITPVGMPLQTLAERVAGQNGRMKKGGEELEQADVSTNWDITSDKTGKMKYFPTQFDKNDHGGLTKQELLNSDTPFPGWQVVFVDGEREVKDVNKDAPTFLAEWQEKNYDPLTNEEIMMLHTEGVVNPFGDETEARPFNGSKFEWALGSYLPEISSNGALPVVFWDVDFRGLYLDYDFPVNHDDFLGVRRSVRVF